ncbi:MAG: SDR family oxidoreductase [Alphaproteobacteria bacterium]|nr:SDR family oxidoreductase [Alphaproteobacteria bacterium]
MTIEPCVLITGAGRRIGRAMALDLGLRGWKVAVHHHSAATDAEEVADEINRRNGGLIRARTFAANLAREEEVAALIPHIAHALGPLTALINNASVFEEDTAETMTRASWDAHMEVNLRAPLRLAQEFAKALPEGALGAIINIIDQRVWRLTPKFFSYTISKSALWTATQTLAQSLGPRIRVNAVGPGPTLRNERQSEADFARQASSTILARGPEPDDICTAIRYLLAAPSVTGQMIAVDGGQHLSWKTPDVYGIPE